MHDRLFLEIPDYSEFKIINQAVDGIICEALDRQLGKVLIKIYYPNLSWSDERMLSFLDQINIHKLTSHDNLLQIQDIGKTKKFPYVVYQYQAVVPLSQIMGSSRAFKESMNSLKQITEVVDFFHNQDILLGNLSPENVYLDENGKLFFIDFGLYGVFREVVKDNIIDGLTNLSINLPEYSTPEQLLGRSPTKSSDIYAIGNLFFGILFQQNAFVGETGTAIALAHLENKINWPNKFPKDMPKAAFKMIRKCMFLEPYKRFNDVKQIIDILDRLNSGKFVWINIPSKNMRGVPGYTFNKGKVYGVSIPILTSLVLIFWSVFMKPENGSISTPQISLEDAVKIVQQTAFVEETPTIPMIIATEVVETPFITANNEGWTPTPTAVKKVVLNQPAIQGKPVSYPRQEINIKNIRQLTEISRLGYGRPEDVDHFNNVQFFVGTSSGVYIYLDSQFQKWIDAGDWVTSVKVSKDGQKLAVGLKNGDIQIWDWKNNLLLTTLEGHEDRISGLAFSTADRNLYSVSYDRYFIVWDLNSGRINQKVLAHATPIQDFAVTGDGRTLVTVADDQGVRVWDLATGKKDYEFDFPGRLYAVAISADDQFVAAGGDEGLIRQWNLKTKQLRTDPIPVGATIWNIEYNNEDQRLIVSTPNGSKNYVPGQLKYPGVALDFNIKPASFELISIFGPDFKFNSKMLESINISWDGYVKINNSEVNRESTFDSMDQIVFSNNSDYLAVRGKNQHTYIWDISTNQLVLDLDRVMPDGYVFTPNGQGIIVQESKTYPASRNYQKPVTKTIYRAYQIRNGQESVSFSERVEQGVISFVKDGTLMISGSLKQSKTWDLSTGYETFFNSYPYNGCWITVSENNGELLQIVSNAGAFYKFDDRTNTICSRSSLNSNYLSALSQDLNTIFLETSKNSIVAIDTQSSQVLWEFTLPFELTALAVSYDNSILAVGSKSGRVILLNNQNGLEVNRFIGSYGAVQSITFSNNGLFLGTTGSDGTTRLFAIR